MNNPNQFIHNRKVTPENVRFYHDFGYLVAADLISPEEISELKKDTVKIFRGEYGTIEGMLPALENEKDADGLFPAVISLDISCPG